jgi:hypothetical protein
VDRALDKLRGLLARRGVTSTSAALVAILGTHSVTAAPAGTALSIVGAALAGTAASSGTTLTIVKLMAISKVKVGLIGALVVAGAATPLIIQNQTQAKLRVENQQLRQQNTQLAEQMTPLAAENLRLSNLIARATEYQPFQQSPSNELLRLRGEVARLRQDAHYKGAGGGGTTDPQFKDVMEEMAVRATQLREKLEQHPERKIPELRFLTDKNWLDAVASADKLESEDNFRQAMSTLRGNAKATFGMMVIKALEQYAHNNGDMLPTDISQLQSYFNQPMDDSLLKRYQLTQTGKLSDLGPGQTLITEIAPRVDDEHDSHYEFSLHGISSTTSSAAEDAFEAAMAAYANANNGALPRTPEQLTAYLQQPIDAARMQKFLADVPANVTTLEQLKAKR